ncbi:MAG TPA: hypothetical protein VE645_00210, partial [Pseudonocardiaceae bacterium]|nr:hypothetical protein [Pseudonocardiaceae bacterium]
ATYRHRQHLSPKLFQPETQRRHRPTRHLRYQTNVTVSWSQAAYNDAPGMNNWRNARHCWRKWNYFSVVPLSEAPACF